MLFQRGFMTEDKKNIVESTLLGEFELFNSRMIGKGAWGEVYHGRQKSLNRPVAIKILKKELTADKDFVKRFQREAECLAKMADEHIIQVYSAGDYQGSYYFIMEYVQGQPLSNFVEKHRKFTVAEIIHITESVAKALKSAWESTAKIVHRDIKPSNIMVSYTSSLIAPPTKEKPGISESMAEMDINITEAKIKVMDFGLAKISESGEKDATIVGTVIGTPKYISPEQGMGQAADIRSDIYSLGIVLYEMATGQIPFEAESAMSMIRHHIYDTALPPSHYTQDFPKDLEAIIMKCIQKAPEKRYKGPKELLEDIEAFKQQGGLLHASKSSLEATMVSDFRRKGKKKWLYPVIAAGLIAAGVATWFLFLKPPEKERINLFTDDNNNGVISGTPPSGIGMPLPIPVAVNTPPEIDEETQKELDSIMAEVEQLLDSDQNQEEALRKLQGILEKLPGYEPAREKVLEAQEKITQREHQVLIRALLADEPASITDTLITEQKIFNRILKQRERKNFFLAKSLTSDDLIDARQSFSPAAYYFMMRLLKEEQGDEYLREMELERARLEARYSETAQDVIALADELLATTKKENQLIVYNQQSEEASRQATLEGKIKVLESFIRDNPDNPHVAKAREQIDNYKDQLVEQRKQQYRDLLVQLQATKIKTLQGYLKTSKKIDGAQKEFPENKEELSAVLKKLKQNYLNDVLGVTAVGDRLDPASDLPLETISIKDNTAMVLVPAGEFRMGTQSREVSDESPTNKIHLSNFYIDKHEVTNARFAKFVKAKKYTTDAEKYGRGWVCNDYRSVTNASWQDPQGNEEGIKDRMDHPVTQVSWMDALEYIRWSGKQLPTEAQWEKAARGAAEAEYPWGDQWNAKKCNSREAGPDKTQPVGSYKTEENISYGCRDMAGNAAEWCRDWYYQSYYQSIKKKDPAGPRKGSNHIFRGGSWENNQPDLRCANRSAGTKIEGQKDCWSDAIGFRCVIEIK